MRILVVEDDPVVTGMMGELTAREEALALIGTVRTEEETFELVGAVKTGEEAMREISRLSPDLVVLDLHLPDVSGFEVMERLEQAEDAPRVLVVSSDEGEATQLAAVRAGARGFVAKTALAGRLADAIRAVGRGDMWFSTGTADRLLQEYRQLWQQSRPRCNPFAGLNERELTVLAAVARGRTDRQIAEELTVSVPAVKARLRSIRRKLNLPNRTEAAVLAAREGLLERPPERCP
jgi:two-component system, NarL family, response regulator LiaR